MAINWSRLHEIRGLDPRPLTYADIVAAVDEQTGEEAGLDWKAQRPTNEAAKVELAKDVAAMANSGGGVIVFGVGERGTGSSKEFFLSPVELTEQADQQVRGTVSSRVRPMIAGIAVDQVPDPGIAGCGFVVVSIPASPEAPHFYEKGNEPPAAPWRNGSHTENLRESQIERAYQDRFNRRGDAVRLLTQMTDATAHRLDFGDRFTGCWIVIASRPIGSPPLGLEPPSRQDALNALSAAAGRENAILNDKTQREAATVLDYNVSTNVVHGLRRWVLRHRPNGASVDATTTEPYAELHHDGSAVFAYPVDAHADPKMQDDERVAVYAYAVERAAAAAVALTTEWLVQRRTMSGAEMLAAIATDPQHQAPLHVFGAISTVTNDLSIHPTTIAVTQIEPVDATLASPVTVDAMRRTAVDLTEGVLHQFGFPTLHALARPA